jgi:hypothetical protein
MLLSQADEPYAAILAEQQDALHRLVGEIRDEVTRAGSLAERQLRGIDAVLAAVSELQEATAE